MFPGQPSTLTLDQLRMFVLVTEHGSFSAAGRHLNRVPSAVSYGIASLEEVLGVALFHRDGRRPTLTPAGTALLEHAYTVLSDVNALQSRARAFGTRVEPSVALAVDAIVPAGALVRLCRAFKSEHPSVLLTIRTEVLGAVAARVLDGTCGFAISGPVGVEDDALGRTFLTHVDIVAVAAPGHPLASSTDLITTEAAREHLQVVITESNNVSGRDHGVLARATWRVADAATKLELILAGLGWGALPGHIVQPHLQSGELVELRFVEWGTGRRQAPLVAIVRRDHQLAPAGRWLLARLPQIFAEEASEDT